MLYSLKAGSYLAKIIPRRIGIKIFKSLGSLFGFIPTPMRKNIIQIHRNISPELNDSQLKTRARKVIAYYAAYWFDIFWLSSPRSKSDIDKIIRAEGESNLRLALEKAKEDKSGVVLALCHLGSFELAGAWLGTIGLGPVVVAERLKPPELFELFTNTRNTAGMDVVAHDDNPTSKLLAALKDNRVICLLADRDIAKTGNIYSFFGKEKSMPQGPATLAYLAKAKVIPVATYLNHDSTVSVIIQPELQIDKSLPKNEIVRNVSQEIISNFEDMIRNDPEQYHVLQYEWDK